MAIVADLSGNFPASLAVAGLDVPLTKPNRTNAGTPVGALTPLYSGELVLDTTGVQLYRGIGVTSNDWLPVDADA